MSISFAPETAPIVINADEVFFHQDAQPFINYWGNRAGVPQSSDRYTGEVTLTILAPSTARQYAYTGAGHDQPIYSVRAAGKRVHHVTADAVFFVDGQRYTVAQIISEALLGLLV